METEVLYKIPEGAKIKYRGKNYIVTNVTQRFAITLIEMSNNKGAQYDSQEYTYVRPVGKGHNKSNEGFFVNSATVVEFKSK